MEADTAAWARRASTLVGARLVAQAVSFAWVLLAARALSRETLGAVAVGLTVMGVTSALAEVGTTRTVVRHGWAGPESLRPTLVAALRWRVGAGAAVGALVAAAALVVGVPASPAVVVLAAVVSTTSGVVDLVLAGLRTVGAIRTEAIVLVGERVLFLAVAGVVLAQGGGAIAVLGAYLTTNVVSLVVVAGAARRAFGPADGRAATARPAPLLDAEGRRTAVATAVGALLPRLAAVVVAVGGTAAAAAAVTVAQRPFDALVVLVATALSAVHPVVRRAVALGDVETARRVLRSAGGAAGVVAVCSFVVAVVAAGPVLRLLGGGDRYADAGAVLAAAGAVAVVSVLRQSLEVAALAEERAGVVARAEVVALAVGLGAGLVLVGPWGAAGAVGAQVLAEAVAAAGIWWAARRRRSGVAPAPPGPSPAVASPSPLAVGG